MAIGAIPPWLHVGPEDYLSATEAGASAGLNAAQVVNRNRIAQQELQQRAFEDAARQDEAQAALAQRAQEADRQALIQQHQDAVTEEYKRQQLAIAQQDAQMAQQQSDMQVQAAMKKFEAQQAYQQLIRGGVSPSDALMQVGPALGIPMAGFASMVGKSVPFTPASPVSQDGVTMVNTGPQRWAQARAPVPTGVEPLTTAPILDPNGQPLKNRFAYRGPTGRMTPLTADRDQTRAITGLQASELKRRIVALQKSIEGGVVSDTATLAKVRSSNPKLTDAEVKTEAKRIINDQIQAYTGQLNDLLQLSGDVPLDDETDSDTTPADTTKQFKRYTYDPAKGLIPAE